MSDNGTKKDVATKIELVAIDSLTLDSILYHDNQTFKPIKNSGGFSYNSSYDPNQKSIYIKAATTIIEHQIVYKIHLIFKGKNYKKEDFHWYDEDSYEYLNSTIEIDHLKVDLANIHFINQPKLKIFPLGLWHWSIDDCSVKYYKIKDKEYFLLNGVDLYCNGSNCTSFQLLAIARFNNKLTVNAFILDGIYPYTFSNIELFDQNNDSYPEFYITKNDVNIIEDKKDFELFTFNLDGNVKKYNPNNW